MGMLLLETEAAEPGAGPGLALVGTALIVGMAHRIRNMSATCAGIREGLEGHMGEGRKRRFEYEVD
jgi:hypothetical protein